MHITTSGDIQVIPYNERRAVNWDTIAITITCCDPNFMHDAIVKAETLYWGDLELTDYKRMTSSAAVVYTLPQISDFISTDLTNKNVSCRFVSRWNLLC